MKMIKRLILTAAAVLTLWLLPSLSVYADEVKLSPEGNWIREGGVNRYDGVQAETREDAADMERRLSMDDYIEVQSLSAEQYEAFIESDQTDWWFKWYITSDDPNDAEFYSNGWIKVYVYAPSFNDWWEDWQEHGSAWDVNRITRMELENSSVVINYRYWWSMERAGTDCSDEINNPPAWCDAGYISLVSPVDAEIRFKLINDNTYYTIYVSANTPFRAKMKYGNYVITQINGVDIKGRDANVPMNNNIQLGWGDNLEEDTPAEMNLTKTVKAYGIKSIDISGKPDRSLDKNQHIPEEKTIVEEPEGEEHAIQAQKPNWFKRILIAVIIAAVCGLSGAFIYFDRRRRRE